MTMVYIFVIGVIIIPVAVVLHYTFIVEPRQNRVPKALFKSSLKNNTVDEKEVFKTLKDANIEPCFLKQDLNKVTRKKCGEFAIEDAEKFDSKLNLRQESDERMDFLVGVAHSPTCEEKTKVKSIGTKK